MLALRAMPQLLLSQKYQQLTSSSSAWKACLPLLRCALEVRLIYSRFWKIFLDQFQFDYDTSLTMNRRDK